MDLQRVTRLFDHFLDYPVDSPVAIDWAHDLLIAGMLLSKKPARVLELGVGSGFVSGLIARALDMNERGESVCVDNFHDWKGEKPPHILGLEQHKRLTFVFKDEYAFLKQSPADQYDLIISDGDHVHAYFFLRDLFRVARKGAVIFFHDTNNPSFANLQKVERVVRAHGLSCYHFKERSLPDERTDRGLLMVVKDRHVAVNIPLGDRMRWQWRMTREARHGFSKGIFRKKDK